MKSVVCIPVYNQVGELPQVLDEIRSSDRLCDTILLVNNGSRDGSDKLIQESGYPYLDLPRNRGIGYGLMTAVDWALENGYEIFGCMAGNAKMLPQEMGRLLGPILRDEADYVTGSRFVPGGESPNLPLFRRAAIPLVNLLVRLLTGALVSDATCGYRAMRLSIFRAASFDWHARWLDTYSFEYYIYAKVVLDGRWRWTEVPVTMRYPRKGRYSKVKPFIGWYSVLKPWIVARFDGGGFSRPEPEISQ